MNSLKRFNLDFARLFVLSFALSTAFTATAACVAPHYQVGRVLENNAAQTSLNISIRLEDFAPEQLICLAESLRQKYPGGNLWVAIFSAYDVAKNYMPPVELTPSNVYMDSKLHGSYVYDKEKHEDYLFIVPDGRSQERDSPFNTRINLPVAGTPVCRLAINGRCLLEFQHPYYPSLHDKIDASGEVTVTGRIRPDGVVSGLAATNVKADQPEWRSVFTDTAIRNLRTWRFERSKHEDPIRITYYFDLTDSKSPQQVGVQVRLPDEVRLRSVRTR